MPAPEPVSAVQHQHRLAGGCADRGVAEFNSGNTSPVWNLKSLATQLPCAGRRKFRRRAGERQRRPSAPNNNRPMLCKPAMVVSFSFRMPCKLAEPADSPYAGARMRLDKAALQRCHTAGLPVLRRAHATINKLIARAAGWQRCCLSAPAISSLGGTCAEKSLRRPPTPAAVRSACFLPRGTLVRGGDVLVAEDGSLIVVKAAAQPVMVVRHCSEHGSPFDLLRAPTTSATARAARAQSDRLLLERDHVLANMLAGK